MRPVSQTSEDDGRKEMPGLYLRVDAYLYGGTVLCYTKSVPFPCCVACDVEGYRLELETCC